MLVIVCGLPGTGKSTLSQLLAGQLPAEHLNSDTLRKQMFKNPDYSEEEKEKVYHEMAVRAESLLSSGKNAILDATFYKRKYRKMMADVAGAQDAEVYRIECALPEKETRKRLEKRKELGKGPSDADYDVYQSLKDEFEPLEGKHLKIDCSADEEEALRKVMEFLGEDNG
ncbi:AAA family ATPase [Candidatus Micrarchaeota archaeon]|nr:AAA family ATPase [Candidatus Micrarchaeota archaeon]